MKLKSTILLIALLLTLVGSSSYAKFNLRFVCTQVDTNFYVKLQIQADTAVKMGNANFVFTFNTTSLQLWGATNQAVLGCTWYNFYTGLYQGCDVKKPSTNRVSVNVVWNGTAGNGEDVPLVGAWKDIADIRFHSLSSTLSATLAWRLITPNQVVFYDDGNILQIRGTLTNSTHVAPVELVSFEANGGVGKVDLAWKTATEVNNHGFDVLRSDKPTFDETKWQNIGFVEGNGSSAVPHEYRYTDRDVPSSGELFYRLRQIDRDGSCSYSQIVRVVLGGLNEFKLYPAYPNPFKSSTAISFSIPSDQHVTVQVFDASGKMVDIVLDQDMPAGFHTVGFNAVELVPGAYRYTVIAGNSIKHGKMVLTR